MLTVNEKKERKEEKKRLTTGNSPVKGEGKVIPPGDLALQQAQDLLMVMAANSPVSKLFIIMDRLNLDVPTCITDHFHDLKF